MSKICGRQEEASVAVGSCEAGCQALSCKKEDAEEVG